MAISILTRQWKKEKEVGLNVKNFSHLRGLVIERDSVANWRQKLAKLTADTPLLRGAIAKRIVKVEK